MTGSPPPIRFGVMVSGTQLRAWELRCLETLLEVPGVELRLVIVDDRPPAGAHGQGRRLRGLFSGRMLFQLYRNHRRRPPAQRWVDASALLRDAATLRCTVTAHGSSEYFARHDIEAVRAHDLHFILRLGFGIVRGPILDVARLGIWSFHHGDEQRYRGQPAGFWEIYHGDPVTGAVLQRLTERLDGGIVLQRGYFRTLSSSYIASRDQILQESTRWPADVCRDVLAGRAGYLDGAPSTTTAPIFKAPTNAQMLRFGWVVGRSVARDAVARRLWRDTWAIGAVRRPITAFLDDPTLGPVDWCPGGPPWSHADPFAVASGTTAHVLYERFDARRPHGIIEGVEWTAAGWRPGSRRSADLPVRGHTSYPFLLRHDGAIYCVPETHSAREVGLYRAASFPADWRKVATLVQDVAAVDPTLCWYGDRWWLFHTDRERNSGLHLYAHHARDLLGPWVPHAANPVKTDIRSSRPAGTPFLHAGHLYRPAQDCSRTYGGRVVLNRVVRLTTEEFDEECAAIIEPDPRSPFPDGVHTMAGCGDVTFVDGKVRTFRWR